MASATSWVLTSTSLARGPAACAGLATTASTAASQPQPGTVTRHILLTILILILIIILILLILILILILLPGHYKHHPRAAAKLVPRSRPRRLVHGLQVRDWSRAGLVVAMLLSHWLTSG